MRIPSMKIHNVDQEKTANGQFGVSKNDNASRSRDAACLLVMQYIVIIIVVSEGSRRANEGESKT